MILLNELTDISFSKTLKYNIISLSWWAIIGLPLAIGLLFIILGFSISSNNIKHSSVKFLLLLALGVSVVVLPINLLIGLLAIFALSISFVLENYYENKA